MKKSKKRNKIVPFIVAALLVVGVAGAGAYIYTSSNKASDSKESTSSNAQMDMSMAGMDHSMNSMNAELQNLKGDKFDEKFLSLMTEHHAGAVDMASYVVSDAKHAELRQLGVNIKQDQQKEIEQMRAWAKQWGYEFTEPTEKAVTAMSTALKGKQGDELDKQFITDMSIHHTGAIEMAQLALKNAKHQELKDFAQRIINAQTKEMSDMNMWASEWGYQLEDNENNPHASM